MAVRMRCRFCRRLFRPDPRVGARQRACRVQACRRTRKQSAQQAWLARNPGYFRGRYVTYVRPWLDRHPDYLRQYRRRQLEAARPAGPGEPRAAGPRLELRDIQDEIRALSRSLSGIRARLPGLIYKTRDAPEGRVQSRDPPRLPP